MYSYVFSIANIDFLIESDFEIDWNPFIKKFIKKTSSSIKYKYKCISTENSLNPKGNLIYHDNATFIFQNNTLEERVFLLPIYEIPMILYKEINSIDRELIINKKYIQYFTIPESFNIFNSLALEKIMIENNAFVLHSSFIIYKDYAILFSAPSGTGKSTQADLWVKYNNALLVNGDRTLIKKEEKTWYAYGFPICGSSKICLNKKAPLKAIIYLSQAKTNSICKLETSSAIKKIISESSINFWNSNFLEKSISIITELSDNIPIYHLSCTKDKNAVIILENELGG